MDSFSGLMTILHGTQRGGATLEWKNKEVECTLIYNIVSRLSICDISWPPDISHQEGEFPGEMFHNLGNQYLT